QSEKELTAIFNNSPAIIMVISSERKVLKINKKGLQLSKKSAEEILNLTTGFALNCMYCITGLDCGKHDECKQCKLLSFITNSLNSKKIHDNTEITIESVENRKPLSSTYLCYIEQLSQKPEVTLLLTLVDITARKDAEKKLIESEHKFRELADALPEIVFEIDNNGKYKFLNKTAYTKFYLNESIEIEQLKIIDFIHPDDHERLYLNVKKVLNGDVITGNDYKSILPDGSTGYFQIFNSPVVKDKKIIGIRGIAIDISERKKMESELIKHRGKLEELVKERTIEFEKQAKQLKESQNALSFLLDDVNESREELLASNREIKKLSQALEQSPSSVIITDINGNIEYVNQQFVKISGYIEKEIIGENPRIQNSGKHSKEFFIKLWNTLISGKNWYGEICNKKKNGELHWEYTSISPLRNSKQEIINFIAVKEDITERKEIEQKLKEYTEELELFNKAMVDRELKIIEMKEEVNSLYKQMGKEIKYPPVWSDSNNSNLEKNDGK
ncbi:MAG: PAS domain S-box protein, partial [Mariniphaga sp.]|nr:PAS domain S-box protein [Mariniphaga sp.]